MTNRSLLCVLGPALSLLPIVTFGGVTGDLPRLRRTGSVTQLYVNGEPFLIRGGELGNSTASDLGVLEGAFQKLERMHLNTVMCPVYWDRIEPAPGKYDFSLVRGAVDEARAHHLHLVLLWFGTWKNSMSCYVPGWMKRDPVHFERARQSSGETMEIISPASTPAREADAQAFAALSHWLKTYDASRQTVLMVQVENEIGMIPEPRDHSPASDRAYADAVPDALTSKLAGGALGPEVGAIWEKAGRRPAGTWSQVFGSDAPGEEIFSAWQFATYAEQVASAGKREYPLPMYANAALIRPGYTPGKYPSAGPLPHLMGVWKLGAPSLDMISPDIYFPNFADWAGRYSRDDNPIFIPETAPSARAGANILYATAHLNAIGVGPFAIENLTGAKEESVSACYEMLDGLSSLVLQAQQAGTVVGLAPQVQFDWTVSLEPQHADLAGITFHAEFDTPAVAGSASTTALPTLGNGRWEAPTGTPLGSVMILQLGQDEFLLAGKGAVITFTPTDGKGHVGIESAQEGAYTVEHRWQGGRWLNGDETHQGRHIHLEDGSWSMQRVRLYRYE